MSAVLPPPASSPRRRRRWSWIVVGLVLASATLLFAAPYLLNFAPVRRVALGVASWSIDGSIEVEHASLGWWSPVRFSNLRVQSDDDQPLVAIAQITGTQPLWRLLFARDDLGRFEFTRPQVHLTFDEHGSNLSQILGPPPPSDGDAAPEASTANVPNVDLILAIVEGSLTVRGPNSPREWTLPRLDVAAGLHRSPQRDRGPIAVVEPGRLVHKVELTPEMCDDLLKFIAPVLSNVTRAAGSFSLELSDEARIPLDEPGAGQLKGEFAIHTIDVGPGPLIRELAQILQLPETIRLADESVVQFEMVDGRVHHSNLKFGLPRLWVETHGSVGLDQSLDLVAEVPLAGLAAEDAPFRQALSQKTLRIPIGGTLSEPKIDVAALGRSTFGLADGALGDLLDDESVDVPALFDQLRQQGWFQDGLLPGAPFRQRPNRADTTTPGDGESSPPRRPLLERLENGLLPRRDAGTTQPSDLNAPHPSATPSTDQRPLRRLLRRTLDAAAPAPADTPASPQP